MADDPARRTGGTDGQIGPADAPRLPDDGGGTRLPGEAGTWVTHGPVWRVAMRLSVPMVLQGLMQNLFTVVDMIFVGRLGPSSLAAVGISASLLGLMWMLAVGVTTGCTALVSQAFGAHNGRRAEIVTAQALVLAGILSILSVFAIPFAGPALRMLGASGDVLREGTPYMQVAFGGSFALFIPVTLSAALRGAGDARTPLRMMVIGNVVNIALDPLLIFGLWGFPALGVAGSAWASVIARGVSTVLLAWAVFGGRHEQFHLHMRDLFPRWGILYTMLAIGAWSSGQQLVRNFSGMAMVRVVALYGTDALAAYAIGMKLWLIFMMPGFGFGNAAATMIGQCLGASRPGRAARAGWVVSWMYAGVAVGFAVAFLLAAEWIVRIFNQDPVVVATGSEMLRWLAPTFVFLAFAVVLGRAMNGAGDTLWPMVITATAVLLLRIPLAYYIAGRMGSATGVWIGMAASNVLQGSLFALAFQWGRWQLIGRRHVDAGLAVVE